MAVSGETCLVGITPLVLAVRISGSSCQTWHRHGVEPSQVIARCVSRIAPRNGSGGCMMHCGVKISL